MSRVVGVWMSTRSKAPAPISSTPSSFKPAGGMHCETKEWVVGPRARTPEPPRRSPLLLNPHPNTSLGTGSEPSSNWKVSVARFPMDQPSSAYITLYVHLSCARPLLGHSNSWYDLEFSVLKKWAGFGGHFVLHDVHWIHVRSVPVDIRARKAAASTQSNLFCPRPRASCKSSILLRSYRERKIVIYTYSRVREIRLIAPPRLIEVGTTFSSLLITRDPTTFHRRRVAGNRRRRPSLSETASVQPHAAASQPPQPGPAHGPSSDAPWRRTSSFARASPSTRVLRALHACARRHARTSPRTTRRPAPQARVILDASAQSESA
ncbi:MAT+ sexual cell fertilization-promoting factor [Striga asiatica]|uniref:MAT+ sexual cell fertilization-promoting factor n=1 Tax=Striga asiatica TaxID=4170 RepID=A0A5A7Q123_STRAF|nr:MAT+ sexual cell fertilization-promoting factor [Striga asiatica]